MEAQKNVLDRLLRTTVQWIEVRLSQSTIFYIEKERAIEHASRAETSAIAATKDAMNN